MPRARSSYVRDANGRFASTPGGPASKKRTPKPKATGGTLAARAQLRASKAKLTPAATRQQKGAVTRASNRLVKAKADNKKKLSVLSGAQNTIRKGGEMARVIAFGKKKAAMQNVAAKKKQAVQAQPTNNSQNKKQTQSTKTTNKLRANQLRDQGTLAIGSRVKTKGFAGGKAAQQRAGGLKSESGPISIRGGARAFTVGKGGKMSAAKQAATSKAIKSSNTAKSRAGQAGKPLARTNKSPVSAAKARYKELNQRARKSSPFRSASENRSAAGAKRSLKAMIAKRGR